MRKRILRLCAAVVMAAALLPAAVGSTAPPARAAAQPSEFVRKPDTIKDAFGDRVASLWDERYDPLVYAYTRSDGDTAWQFTTDAGKGTSKTGSMLLTMKGKKDRDGYVTRVDVVAKPAKTSDATTAIYRSDWTTAAACALSAYLGGLGVDLHDAKSILNCDLNLPIDRKFLDASRDASKVTPVNRSERVVIERQGVPVRLTVYLSKKGVLQLTIAMPSWAFNGGATPTPTPAPAPSEDVTLADGVTNRVRVGKSFTALLKADDKGAKWSYSISGTGGAYYRDKNEIIACGDNSSVSALHEAWRFTADRQGTLTLICVLTRANGQPIQSKAYTIQVEP